MNGATARRAARAPAQAPRAVFFDLDGTLVDSAPDLAGALDSALHAAGLPVVEVRDVRPWVGGGAALLVRRGLRHALGGEEPRADLQESVLEAFLNAYERDICRLSCCYPGAAASLEVLARAGLRLACVTNKRARFTGKLLRALGLFERFDIVVSGDTTECFKPDPEPLLYAARALGLAPADCLMVGDSENDIRAARAAGIPLLWFPHGYHHGPEPSAAEIDGILPCFKELPGLLGITE